MRTKPKSATVGAAEVGSAGADGVDAAARRHLLLRAATVGLLMRHCVNVIVSAVALCDNRADLQSGGRWLLITVLSWSLYRLWTRSRSVAPAAVDLALTLAVCAALPLLTADPAFYLTNSAPQAIAGTAVVSVAVSFPIRVSLPVCVAIAVSYAYGAAGVIGWERTGSVMAVYFFAVQWSVSALIRNMLLRVASAVDRAREIRVAAELGSRVDRAVMDFEREQLALLHDTAASTLLMVGQGAPLPAKRIAQQARRDLQLLRGGAWRPAAVASEVVAPLRAASVHTATPVRFVGSAELWLDGETAQAVISAAREVMNNVDRHARARSLCIDVTPQGVVFTDDGVGFDVNSPAGGHGITESIHRRMERVHGSATITSAPRRGTRVDLRWSGRGAAGSAEPAHLDPDRFIERVRFRYAVALTGFAVLNLIVTVPYSITHTGLPRFQIACAVVAALCALSAIPALRGRPVIPVRGSLAVLFAVAVGQPLLLAPEQMGTQADWFQGGIGWCAVPLVLMMPLRRGAVVLVALWVTGATFELVRHPGMGAAVNIMLGTASILGIQLFALVFDGLMRDAAARVAAETEMHKRVVFDERIAQAVAEDYRRHYARLVDNIVPLLEELTKGWVVTPELRRRARIESRRMRTLFDQSRSFAHPLMRRLRTATDAAEDRGVEVTSEVVGDLAPMDCAEITQLSSPVEQALSFRMNAVHLVVNATPQKVSLSVVCRGIRDAPVAEARLRAWDGAEVITLDDTVWLLVEHADG